MGNNSNSSLDEVQCFPLDKFQKEETPRKMTIHILSDNVKDCISLVEYLTGETFPKSDDALFEEKIICKINLYSFMNYKVYDSPTPIMNDIKTKTNDIFNNPQSKLNYSEVILIINNEKINEQINTIKKEIINDKILSNEIYYNPFIILLSPNHLDLKGFIPSKTYQFKITLKDILYFDAKNKIIENNYINEEIVQFIRRINVIFSYYNELGDNFSFINSKGKKVDIIIEDFPENPAFIDILLLGKTGSGKSTFINLLLDEKKSIEGGRGISTTSKNLIVYRKKDIPIRFYDVKGMENKETVENYSKILIEHNLNSEGVKNPINAIFYCMNYTIDTVLYQMEYQLFDKLIEFNIPILFIITKTPYNPKIKHNKKKVEQTRINERDKIKNVVLDLIKECFINKGKKEEEAKQFIKNFVKFYFVNLRRIVSEDLPPFGIEEVLSFFSKSVSEEDWEKLEMSCKQNDEEDCKNLCFNNPFLHFYSDFNKLNIRNKGIALEYLKGLKAGAFFSGWIPGLDIGMEYFYRFKFKEKLKHLYGFDLDKAEKFSSIKEENKINKKEDENEDLISSSTTTENDSNKRSNNIESEEKKIDEKLEKEINNKARNTSSIIRGIAEIGGVIIKSLPTITTEAGSAIARGILSTGFKAVSWALLPVTCVAFGTWSCVNLHKDCMKILDIFDKAFTPLKFETLMAYIKSYRSAIDYLENIGKKIIEDDERENEENEEEL